MKFIFSPFMFLIFTATLVFGQGTDVNGSGYGLKKPSHDTSGVNRLLNAANEISFFNPDSAIILAKTALELTREIGFRKGEAEALNTYGEAYHFLGDYPQALKKQFDALQINREMKDPAGEAETLGCIGIVYIELGQYRQALLYLLPAKEIYQQLPGEFKGSFVLANIGDAYNFLYIRDSAFYYLRKAYELSNRLSSTHLKSFILEHMGQVYAETGRTDSALKFYNDAIQNARLSNDRLNMSVAQNRIAGIYESIHQYDSALVYARKGFDNAQSTNSKPLLLQSGNLLAQLYNKIRKPDSAFFYLNAAVSMRDSLYGPEKLRKLQVLMLEEQQKQELIIRQAEQLRNKIRYSALLSGLVIFLLIAFFLWRNNQHKKESNILLRKEKLKVEQAYEELKSTQAQLIQSEKMASLGELTAGIAHEIQNPLNFVNNFSDLNNELVVEANQEISKGNIAEVKNILEVIRENSDKINHHGKRADVIVKGMLQHSRNSSGVKETTDINALCDEYLRLSYHGLRAKDKTFNASFKTEFDDKLGQVNVLPQDLGRVILNLINNAFYAVTEKMKEGLPGYEPTVTVSTKRLPDKVEIKVKDNGMGIPSKVLEKIFQPFFTTKPTGQGTGLGLSLSYDIIKKGHGGELLVATKESEGTSFTIVIPV